MSLLLASAIEAVDTANAADPNLIWGRPLALVQGELATKWLTRRARDGHTNDISAALAIAARAHHLRRWTVPRAQYPDGRAGYLRWRRGLKDVHAAALAEVLAPLGVAAETLARAQQLVRKDGLDTSAPSSDTQVFEDVVCLVFLETQFDTLLGRLNDEAKAIAVLRKTLTKMSPEAIGLAGSVALAPPEAAVLARALAEPR